MARCAEPHPSQAGVLCAKEEHPFGSHFDGTSLVWDGTPAPVRVGSKGARGRLHDAAARAGRPLRTGPPAPAEAFYRKSGHAHAQEAMETYDQWRHTARGRVLDYLRERAGTWVDMVVLREPEIGGSSGDRRARELRDMGFPIDNREDPDRPTVWQWIYKSSEETQDG